MTMTVKPKLMSERNPFFGALLSGIRTGAITAENAETVAVATTAAVMVPGQSLPQGRSGSSTSAGSGEGVVGSAAESSSGVPGSGVVGGVGVTAGTPHTFAALGAWLPLCVGAQCALECVSVSGGVLSGRWWEVCGA